MKYFIADLHFGHENIIKFSKRPYSNAQEMDDDYVKIWNSKVKKDDDIYIVGDFCMSSEESVIKGYCDRLNGRKHLIIGNHDYFVNKPWVNKYFTTVQNYLEINYNKTLFSISHYPFSEWNKSMHGSIHVHGHIHNNGYSGEKPFGNIINVGIDVIKRPISLEEIYNIFKKEN
jgi:calcineurin-like phosphoesterase family protein